MAHTYFRHANGPSQKDESKPGVYYVKYTDGFEWSYPRAQYIEEMSLVFAEWVERRPKRHLTAELAYRFMMTEEDAPTYASEAWDGIEFVMLPSDDNAVVRSGFGGVYHGGVYDARKDEIEWWPIGLDTLEGASCMAAVVSLPGSTDVEPRFSLECKPGEQPQFTLGVTNASSPIDALDAYCCNHVDERVRVKGPGWRARNSEIQQFVVDDQLLFAGSMNGLCVEGSLFNAVHTVMGIEYAERILREFMQTRVSVSVSLKTLSTWVQQFAAYVSLEQTTAELWQKDHFTRCESRKNGVLLVRMETLNGADHVIRLDFSDRTCHETGVGWILDSVERRSLYYSRDAMDAVCGPNQWVVRFTEVREVRKLWSAVCSGASPKRSRSHSSSKIRRKKRLRAME